MKCRNESIINQRLMNLLFKYKLFTAICYIPSKKMYFICMPNSIATATYTVGPEAIDWSFEVD